jgi:hypothetical protein
VMVDAVRDAEGSVPIGQAGRSGEVGKEVHFPPRMGGVRPAAREAG